MTENKPRWVSDEQWDQIFRLACECELNLSGAEFLDRWVMEGVPIWNAETIILWLCGMPKKEQTGR